MEVLRTTELCNGVAQGCVREEIKDLVASFNSSNLALSSCIVDAMLVYDMVGAIVSFESAQARGARTVGKAR